MASADLEVYRRLRQAFDGLGLRWYVFGAQAAILYGAVRLTEDIDVTVDTGQRSTHELVSALRAVGVVLRISDSEAFVQRTRVLPCIDVSTRTPVDVVLAGPGPEELFLERAVEITIGDERVPVASAEDLVVMKVLAGRPKDLEDVVAVLVARGSALDRDQVREMIAVLEAALDQSDLLPLLEQCFARAARP